MTVQIPVELDRKADEPLQLQLFAQIRGLVLSGRLRPGQPLPASRVLAEQLGVSRNTVVLAYDRLLSEGYLETRRGRGTFVSAAVPEQTLRIAAAAADRLEGEARPIPRRPPVRAFRAQAVVDPHRGRLFADFWLGRPDPGLFPLRLWRSLVLDHLAQTSVGLAEYGDPAGLPDLRRAIAERLGPTRGITVDPDQVIVTGGSQEALNVIARLLVDEGTPVVIENPTYQGAAFVFESYGARLVPVPVDAEGIDVDALPREPAALLYVTPSHQYPLGFTLSRERRLRLLDWARRTGARIVEDDYDSDFRYEGSPLIALKGLDQRGTVIYIGTFSKSLGAGLRLGFLVVPPDLASPAATVKALLDNGRPWMEQAVLAAFLRSDSFDHHLRRIRQCYRSRRDCLIEALRRHFGEIELSGVEGGMHLAWHLPAGLPPAPILEARARERGVGVYSLSGGAAWDFGGCRYTPSTLLFGYAAVPEAVIPAAVAQLAAVVAAWRGRPTRPAAPGRSAQAQTAPARP